MQKVKDCYGTNISLALIVSTTALFRHGEVDLTLPYYWLYFVNRILPESLEEARIFDITVLKSCR